MLKRANRFLNLFGIFPETAFKNLSSLSWFFADYKKLKKQLGDNHDFPFRKWYPIFNDKHASSGEISGHYFYQDIIVAQKIYKSNPQKHIDIGSSISGFVAHVASFREIEVFDIRPLDCGINNIKFMRTDFMKVEDRYQNYCDSISCLHVIEHFGLGRYNDPIDAFGHIKGLNSIHKVLKTGGKFYFSTPIGPQRIEFNAHRVFSLSYLFKLFEDKYEILSFSYVDDNGRLHENVHLTESRIADNFGCLWGCGIFELLKVKD